MQVRTGGAAAHPREADALPLADRFSGLHVDAIQMAVQADQAVAVIDKNAFAVEEIVIGGEHDTLRIGPDRRTARGCDIEPGVWCARLTVEEAADTKAPGEPSGRRQNEPGVGVLGFAPMPLQALNVCDLAFDALQVAGRKLHLAVVLERDPLFRIVLGFDAETDGACHTGFVHPQLVCAGKRVQRQPNHSDPLPSLGSDQDLLFTEPGARRPGRYRTKGHQGHAAGNAGRSRQAGASERGQRQSEYELCAKENE